MRKPPCRHVWDKWLWEKIGPAPDFAGQPCALWRCKRCETEREVFATVDLTKVAVKATEADLIAGREND